MFRCWKKRLIPVVLIRKEVGYNFLGKVKVIQLQLNVNIISVGMWTVNIYEEICGLQCIVPERCRGGKLKRLRGFQAHFCPFTLNYPKVSTLCACWIGWSLRYCMECHGLPGEGIREHLPSLYREGKRGQEHCWEGECTYEDSWKIFLIRFCRLSTPKGS